jgi:hypothetical protein
MEGLTNSIGPLAAQSLELPLPYSAPASTMVSCHEALYLCQKRVNPRDQKLSAKIKGIYPTNSFVSVNVSTIRS